MEFRQETENFHTTGLSKWICLNLDAELIYLDWCSLYSFGLCLLAWFEFFSILKLNSFLIFLIYKCNKVQFSCSVLYDSLWPHGVQHSRLPCPSPTPGVCSNSTELMVPTDHLILCRPLLLLPSVFPSIKVFSNEYSGLISFGMDWLDLLAVQGTLKSFLEQHSSKASILLCLAFFIVQLSDPYLTMGKTIALLAK